ncbi:MAG: PcfB family protein [Eubacterium sp.]|nr:PcfB family protein [Eubacterium sp.]
MDNGAEMADQIVRIVLQGSVFLVKTAGSGAAQMINFLAAASKNRANSAGQQSLKKLLESGSQTTLFTIRGQENYDKFREMAKPYGIAFAAVKLPADLASDEVFDVLVRVEDAAKINRVIERLGMADVKDVSSGATAEVIAPETVEEREIADVRDLLGKMLQRSETELNPMEVSDEPSLSDTSSSRSRIPGNREDIRQTVENFKREASSRPEVVPGLESMLPGEEEDEEKKAMKSLLADMLQPGKDELEGEI